MAYSANIDTVDPGNSEFARLGAGRIRAVALAMKERLNSAFVNADADPLQLKDGVLTGAAKAEVLAALYPAIAGEVGVVNKLYPVGHHRRYGAAGDGVTNDLVAVQNAWASVAATAIKGGIVRGEPGDHYLCQGAIVIPGSNSFINSSKHTWSLYGCRLSYSTIATNTDFIQLSTFIGQEGKTNVFGGTFDGSAAGTGTSGFAAASMNVTWRDCTIRYFKRAGISFRNTLAAPSICDEIHGCHIQLNKVGIESIGASSSALYVHGCRIEGNDEEGAIMDGAGRSNWFGNTLETNGFVNRAKPEMSITNSADVCLVGNYFEAIAFQDSTLVLIEGGATQPFALFLSGNRFVGYFQDAVATPLLNSYGLSMGMVGVVDCVVAHGNSYFGPSVGCRVGTFVRGFDIGPDSFSDSFTPGLYANVKMYDIQSTYPGEVHRLSRFESNKYLHGRQDRRRHTIAYSAAMNTDAGLGNYFEINANTGAAFTMLNPTNKPTHTQVESLLTYRFLNTSGGALGAITWGTDFKVAAGFAGPGTGTNGEISFRWDPNLGKYYEIGRSAVFPPN